MNIGRMHVAATKVMGRGCVHICATFEITGAFPSFNHLPTPTPHVILILSLYFTSSTSSHIGRKQHRVHPLYL